MLTPGSEGVPAHEQHLVIAARDGDRRAFEALVRATFTEVYTLAVRSTGNEEDARDVVQEAYLRAYRGLGRFRGEARFSTWLYRITANCAATLRGRRRRHRHEVLLTDEVFDEHPEHDPALRAEGAAFRRELDAALRHLPTRLRHVVVLRDVYDLPHEAIAAELGISETAAKVRLHRARRKLKELLFDVPGRETPARELRAHDTPLQDTRATDLGEPGNNPE